MTLFLIVLIVLTAIAAVPTPPLASSEARPKLFHPVCGISFSVERVAYVVELQYLLYRLPRRRPFFAYTSVGAQNLHPKGPRRRI